MSEHDTRGGDRRSELTLESGIEALRSSPEFRGPAEPPDGHHCNDHLALIYETREEQFSALVPFLRQGLERGERCLYVVDERSEAEVLAALRAGGVDADAALESGALTFHTAGETYLRNGEFDPDEMIDFYADAIEEATEEYEALRVAAETAWILDDATDVEEFIEYEARVNDLFADADCIALCQYDRTSIPPEIVRDVVRSHPHLVYRDAVCHNFYYTPPEELAGPDRPDSEVDRMMGTLLDRTEAKAELLERKRSERKLYEITADSETSFREKVRRLLRLGRERFGFDIGLLMREEAEAFRVVEASGAPDAVEAGVTTVDPLPGQYCRRTVTLDGPLAVEDAEAAGWDDDPLYRNYGLRCYAGVRVTDGKGTYGTVCFSAASPREEPVTEAERTFLDLMGQWISYELERRERERYLREQNEITADPARPFEERLQDLFELGCERFDLELGAMARVDPETDAFEIEYTSDDHEYLESGFELPLSETYCAAATDSGTVASVSNPSEDGYADVTVHRNFGLKAYLGTHIDVDGGRDRTFFFVSSEPRSRGFSDEDRAFQRLMGQWVKYELEHRHRERHQRKLYEIAAETGRTFEEKRRDLFELGCERFDLELGGVARIDPATDRFEVESVSADHEHLAPGERVALSETYCRVFADGGTAVGISDPAERGFEGTLAYEEFGVNAYLGTHIELDSGLDRTLFFVSSEPRESEFSEEDRTFLHLMGQWLKYEFERRRREDRLAGLNELSRALMEAETAAEMSDRVVEAAAGALDLPVAAVALYDEREGTLRVTDRTDAAATLLRVAAPFDVGDGIGWDAFVENDSRRESDPLDGDPSGGAPFPTEMAALPLGGHGVLLAATTESDGFSPSEFEFVQTVAANGRAALDRIDRERQLHEREQTLEEQNEALERVNRINDIIREIDQALVEASTRDEIEAVVCEQLAGVGPYELAWIGDRSAATDEVTPRRWAGTEKGYLDEVRRLADGGRTGDDPTRRAARTREPQVVENILTDASAGPWRQAALNRGYHASLALPLIYDDSMYGVLNVYAGQPEVFDELEQAVLAELSDTIAFAINAIESKRALVGSEVTELEFGVGGGFPLSELAAEAGCRVALESCIPRADESLRLFVSTRGAPAADVLEFASDLSAGEVTPVTEHEEDGETVTVFELSATGATLCETVLDHGGVVRELAAADGEATVRVELPTDANVREFVEMFRTKYPGSELVAQRTRERERRTPTEFSARLREKLTPRQLEVLQTAYYSGFFEKPRPRNGGEVAESLGVTQPTFNHHLRASHRKLCELLFEESR